MKLNELADKPAARHVKKRRGQGIGSGLGKTSGRGHKGYKARSGASLDGFEGGQTPIHMRTPKRGFSNRMFEKRYAVVNVGRLQEAVDKGLLEAGQALDAAFLKEKGIIRRIGDGLRIIGKGEIKTNFTITATGASVSAGKAIEAAGGKLVLIEKKTYPARQVKRTTPEAPAGAAAAKAPETAAPETSSPEGDEPKGEGSA